MAKKENSLLEIAVELLSKKRTPQKLNEIVRDVMTLKGLKPHAAEEKTPQFLMDFMLSGYFVYCGEEKWDLKDHQPTKLLDCDASDYEISFGDDDVLENELKDDFDTKKVDRNLGFGSDIDDDEDDDEEDDEEDEFTTFISEDDIDGEVDSTPVPFEALSKSTLILDATTHFPDESNSDLGIFVHEDEEEEEENDDFGEIKGIERDSSDFDDE